SDLHRRAAPSSAPCPARAALLLFAARPRTGSLRAETPAKRVAAQHETAPRREQVANSNPANVPAHARVSFPAPLNILALLVQSWSLPVPSPNWSGREARSM